MKLAAAFRRRTLRNASGKNKVLVSLRGDHNGMGKIPLLATPEPTLHRPHPLPSAFRVLGGAQLRDQDSTLQIIELDDQLFHGSGWQGTITQLSSDLVAKASPFFGLPICLVGKPANNNGKKGVECTRKHEE